MFDDILKYTQEQLDQTNEPYEYEDVIRRSSKHIYERMCASEKENFQKLDSETEQFKARNFQRWELGFQKLEMFHQISIEAGMEFQKYFLTIPEYVNDPLLGVLIRQHANACRITGEIILLLRGGYADGALARWRTLFEILVTCLVLHKHGNEAANNYILHGKNEAIRGMEEYQKTAQEMNRESYSEDEISIMLQRKAELDQEKSYHWAQKYTGFSKLEKLREYVGLGKWSHDYMWASRNIHAYFSEMLSLQAMSEAKQDCLLVGQSNSGMIEPASMTAITLMQITTTFITAHINEENNLDYTNSMLFMMIMEQYADAVGESFLECLKIENEAKAK
jgi:hypothetical protein